MTISKNKAKYLITLSLLAMAISAICLFVPTITSKLLLIASVSLFFLMVMLSFDISNNVFFLCFLICFFVFLLGSDLYELLLVGEFTNKLSEGTRIHTYVCLLLSVASLWLGYSVKVLKRKKTISRESEDSARINNLLSVRKVCLLAFYVSFIPYLLTLLDTVAFVQTSGYNDYYVSYSSHIPILIQKIGDLCPLSFFIFIASMPNKKQIAFPSFLMIACCLLNLLTGKRFFTIAFLMILLAYFIKRNDSFSGGELWFKKRYYLLITISVLIAGGFLSWYGYYRMGISSTGNIFEHFFKFIDMIYQTRCLTQVVIFLGISMIIFTAFLIAGSLKDKQQIMP